MPIAFSYLSCRSRWALLVIYCLSLTYTLCTWASGVDHFLCCYPLHQSMILKAFLVFMEALGQEIISCPSLNDIDFCLISMKYSRTKNAFCLSSSKDSFYFYTFFFWKLWILLEPWAESFSLSFGHLSLCFIWESGSGKYIVFHACLLTPELLIVFYMPALLRAVLLFSWSTLNFCWEHPVKTHKMLFASE